MRKHVAFPGVVVVLVTLSTLSSGGCERRKYYISDCETSHPGPECLEKETCPGQCLPIPPVDWTEPLLLWSGDAPMAPDCPADRAPTIVWEGHADPADPPECPTCTCEPPSGECGLPSSLIASTAFCGDAGIEFDFSGLFPDPNDCNESAVIVGMGDLKSVTVSALSMTESGCTSTALPPPPKAGPASWKTYARACRGVASPPCLDPGLLCVPTAEPPPEGFSQCIYRAGDFECPPAYPDKRLFFHDLDDTRACSPCACGDPVGGGCMATISIFQGPLCSAEVPTSLDAVSADPECNNILPVADLRGKKVKDLTYLPGECPATGGDPVGSAGPTGPSTFCCQP